ncbi:MAG: protein kinase domain-containing protein, partial [Planctomycetia bacterium]
MSEHNRKNDELIGQTIAGRYRIISRLGAGGMGVAYRAWDGEQHVPVVLKMPHRHVLENAESAERFAREIRLLQGLSHPHVVPIVDSGEHEGLPYIVMRFLPGGSLANRRLRDEDGKARPNPAGMLHLWLPAVAAALDHAHANGILHRDVKPSNIFFDAFWEAFLGDFGIAKIIEESESFDRENTLTATNMGIGTLEYMGPEQFLPKPALDGRFDQYALAVTAYELLAGRRPFTGTTAHLIVEITNMPAPRLDRLVRGLPPSLVEAVHRALAKNPEERFSTCREFASQVLRDVPLLVDEPDTARLLCPKCENILKLQVSAAGQKGKCPRCQTPMEVADDLGALWLLDEARRQRSAATIEADEKADSSGTGFQPAGTRLATDSELKTFGPASRRTTIGRRAAKLFNRITAKLALRKTANKMLRWGAARKRLYGAMMRSPGFNSFLVTLWCTAVASIVIVAVMGLIPVGQSSEPRPFITLVLPDADDEFSEFEIEELPQEQLQDVTDPVADVIVTAEVTVQPVDVAGLADDLEAAPLAVELTDLGSETAPASDMMATLGAIGGMAGGVGGRTKAAKLAAANGGGADTERAVDRALTWIKKHQLPDGGWSFDLNECPECKAKCMNSGTFNDRAGATALALLPMLGRGYTHREGPYRKQIEAGIKFLTNRSIQGKGNVMTPGGGNMYSQGLVGIALSECYAMSQDNQLAAPTQAVLNFIMQAQDPVGGGWRYTPRQPGDTSAVGWQIMAL